MIELNFLQFKYSEENASGGYLTSDVPILYKDVITQEQFTQLTKKAMHGCELAESLAHTHRSRPCFKKIDSLCARMKQDLVRPDSVLANINSQGIAWAVKDFIFVFTRIVSAWVIIKGYVYNTPNGLGKVKAAFSDDFFDDFANWQDTTIKFIDSIIKSFVNLDEMVQSQRAAYQKNDSGAKMSSGKNSNKESNHNNRSTNSDNKRKAKSQSLDNLIEYLLLMSDSVTNTHTNNNNKAKSPSPQKQLNDLTAIQTVYNNVMENSEETQLKAVETGKYFKTGLYNPLQKDNLRSIESKSIIVGNTNFSTVPLPNGKNYDIPYLEPSIIINNNNNSNQTIAIENLDMKMNRSFENVFSVDEKKSNFEDNFIDNSSHNELILPPIGSEKKCMIDSPTTKNNDSIDLKNVEYLLQKITNLTESNYFFVAQFTNNYVRFYNLVCVRIYAIRFFFSFLSFPVLITLYHILLIFVLLYLNFKITDMEEFMKLYMI